MAGFSQTEEPGKEDLDGRNAYLLQRYTGGGEMPSQAERIRTILKMNAEETIRRKAAGSAGVVLDPTWKPIGPRPSVHSSAGGDIQIMSEATSGHVEAVAVDPRNRDVVYAGAATGGLWKSVDAGANWTPLTDFQPSIAIGSIALDPTNPDVIYVGTGDSTFSLGSLSGAGVLKSTDAGQTWQMIGAEAFHMSVTNNGLGAPGISISPDGKRILVAMNSTSGDASGGIFLSTDAGATWIRTLSGVRASDVQFASNTVAYAGVSLAIDANSGVYKSVDGGATWSFVRSLGALIAHPARTKVSVSPLNPQTVYAALADGNNSNILGGMFRSSDAGATWQQITVPNFCGPQCGWDMVVSVSPVDPNIVWVGGAASLDSLLRSSDGGLTWTRANNNIHVDHHALVFSADGTRLYGGNDGGIYSTEDVQSGTVVWRNLNGTIQVTQFYAGLGLHPTDPNLAIGGTQDNGTSFYAGSLNWTFIYGGDTGAGVISATDPSTLYVASTTTIVKATQPSSAFAFGAATIPDNAPWASMLVGDPTDGNTLYFGGTSLWVSRDGAKSWFKHSDPISDQPDQGFISTIAVSPSNPDVVYFGAGNGVLRRTAQAKSAPLGSLPVWVDISTGLPKRFITSVNVSSIDPLQAAVSIGGVGTAKIFVTYDGGASWTNISGNLPDIPTNAVVIDPDLADTFYAGTDVGVFFTIDRGATWNPLGHGLPRVAVWDMKMHRPSRILRLLTYGRGMWDAAVPIQYSGPALAVSPQTFRFPDSNVSSASTTSITLSNIGSQTLTFGAISPSSGFAVASHCAATLAPAATCSIDVSFTPVEPGATSGEISVPNDALNAINKVFVSGYGLLPADNDTYATARVISVPEYHAKLTTFNATRAIDDPGASCPFSIPNKSVWFRYTAPSALRVSLDTAGSDYNATITVWTGKPGTFRNVTCAFSFSQALPATATFDAAEGTEYAFLVSHERNTGGLLALNFVASAIPAIVPPSISSILPDHRTAGSDSFTLTVKGSAFTSNSVVKFASSTLPTTFVNATELNAQVSAALVTSIGNVSISVVDGQSSSGNTAFSVTGLTMNATTTTGTVSAGQSGKFTIALNPSGGVFDAPATFSCRNLPQFAACSFAPASITPNSQQSSTVLTISTAGPVVASTMQQRPGFLAMFVLAPLFAAAVRMSKRRLSLLTLSLMFLICGVACGGGGGGNANPGPTNNPVPRTPPGTYTITVQVSSGTYSVTTPVTLTVQ